MKKLYPFLLFIFISTTGIYAQVNIDSLKLVWNDEQLSDSTRLSALKEIAWNGFLFNHPDSAFYYSQLQYDYAKINGLKSQMADALNTQGVSFAVRGNPVEAIKYYTQSLEIRKEIGDKEGISNSLNNIGILHKQQGSYDEAISYYEKSLQIDKEIGNEIGQASSLNNIGLVYKIRGELNMALKYFHQSLTIEEKLGDKQRIGAILNNIGITYKTLGDFNKTIEYYNRSLILKEEIGNKLGVSKTLINLGIIHFQNADYNKAEDYFQRSLKLKEEIQDNVGIGKTLYNLGNLYYQQQEFTKAIEFFQRSLEIQITSNNQNSIAQCHSSLGNVYLTLGQYPKALLNFRKAQEIGEQIGDKQISIVALENMGLYYYKTGELEKSLSYLSRAHQQATAANMLLLIRNISNDIYKVYKDLANAKQALKFYELYINTKDSILNEENQRQLIQQEYQYKYEKQAIADSIENAKEFQLQELIIENEKIKNIKQQQQAYFLYAGIVLLSALIFLLLYGYNIANKRKNIIEQQKIAADKTNEELRNKNHKIRLQADMIKQINKEVKLINNSLAYEVTERTMKIEELNKKLTQYAFSNSHEVRGPLARILGLLNLWTNENVSDEERIIIIEKMTLSAFELDEILSQVTTILNEEEQRET